jgi:Flp pilus assembly protein TadG
MSSNRRNAEFRRALRRGLLVRGQSIVEFGLTLPILALLLVAASDFARVFYTSVAVNNAARAGAQYGSQTGANAANSNSQQIEIKACNDYAPAATPNCNSSRCTCGTPTLTATASQCTCGTANPPSNPACGTSYVCSDYNQATFVVVNTSATFTTLVNYPGITHSYTVTGQAIMQVEQ